MSESLAVKRLALLPAAPATPRASSDVKIRRYKLVSRRFDDRVAGQPFAHLKRTHD